MIGVKQLNAKHKLHTLRILVPSTEKRKRIIPVKSNEQTSFGSAESSKT